MLDRQMEQVNSWLIRVPWRFTFAYQWRSRTSAPLSGRMTGPRVSRRLTDNRPYAWQELVAAAADDEPARARTSADPPQGPTASGVT